MISRKVVLKFPHGLLDQPIICNLVKHFNIEFNILKAYVTPKEEGLLILALSAKNEDYNKGIAYLRDSGVSVELLSKDVVRNEDKCTHCGACITICPTGALVIDKKTRKVLFNNEKCIACELCVRACPVKAMEINF